MIGELRVVSLELSLYDSANDSDVWAASGPHHEYVDRLDRNDVFMIVGQANKRWMRILCRHGHVYVWKRACFEWSKSL